MLYLLVAATATAATIVVDVVLAVGKSDLAGAQTPEDAVAHGRTRVNKRQIAHATERQSVYQGAGLFEFFAWDDILT